MRERQLLHHIRAIAGRPGGRVVIAPGDDMAMVTVGEHGLLAAVDQVVDGRHFRLETTPADLVGRKAVTRCLSDVAAMAGRPLAALAAVVLPPELEEGFAEAMFDAVHATGRRYGCPVVGGDIAFHARPGMPLTCSVTVLAEPGRSGAVTRDGGRAGDFLHVTGRLGGSLEPDGQGRHLTFEPRIDAALDLAARLGERLHAMIDLSDGLGRDCLNLAEASALAIRIDSARVPCADGVDWRRAMSDGEDYELCFLATGDVPDRAGDVAITRVGAASAPGGGGPRVEVVDGERVLDAGGMGWEHRSP